MFSEPWPGKRIVKTFVYKRTHKGDPDKEGRFGIRDCMGRARNFEFDAVIGIGGVSVEAKRSGIHRKVNWIGIGPRKQMLAADGWPLLTFDYFVLCI